MTKQIKMRNVPHAEIKKRWLEDDSLTVEFYRGEEWVTIDPSDPSWCSEYSYRIVNPKVQVEVLYLIAYQLDNLAKEWKVSENRYKSVVEFENCYSNGGFIPGTPCIIKTSAVQEESAGEVVFTSPAVK
jgi:hypothetical protein